MTQKTNYRQIVNPDYLGAYSLDNGNYDYSQREGLISRCEKAIILGKQGKKSKVIAHTNLGKPYILNATGMKLMHELTGSRYPEDWNNINVIFYVKTNERSVEGGTCDALKIKANPKFTDQCRLPILEPTNVEVIGKLKVALQNGYTINDFKVKYQISSEVQKLIES